MPIDPRMVKWDDEMPKPKIDAKMVKWDREPGKAVSIAAGLGTGIGNVALGAQNLLGMGLEKVGIDRAGQWLQEDAVTGREKLKSELAPYKEANPLLAGGGEFVGEVGATLPVGGFLAKGVGMIPGAATKAAPLLQSLRTGGMSLGTPAATTRLGMAGNAGLRAVGGGTTAGVSTALIDPEATGTGAAFGAVLPGAVQVLGKAGGALGSAFRDMRTPASAKAAKNLADALDMTPQQLREALAQQGPSMLPGYKPTVPQILQNPVTSQLQRALKTAGVQNIADAERIQQSQMMAAINRVAPVDLSIQDAAERAGGAIERYALPAERKMAESVSRAFDAVDPLDESALYLPIDKMQSAAARYLGEGTFGTGAKAREAIGTAQRVGTMELPAIAPMKASKSKIKDLNLEQAVRKMGGIKLGRSGLGGELRDLGIRESGTTGLINNKSGKSADLLASEMHQLGYIPDADAGTLLEALRNGAGRKLYASDMSTDSFAARAEAAMGDAPGAEIIPKAVPFRTVQNLRSSLSEAAESASAKGANKEAAALREMVGQIDSRVNRAAGDAVEPGEFFPKEMGDQYRKALEMHADKMRTFKTGPQIGMFRQGADNQRQLQGAEIPSKFFSGRLSQAEDMRALKRLVADKPALMDEMKRFAVTEAVDTASRTGDLTSKYVNWLKRRSGASRELFTEQELQTLKEVGKAVQRQINAEELGRVSGSDTAQKLAALNNLGALDSPFLNVAANRLPLIGSFTGPALAGLRDTASRTRNNMLAGLMANPDDLAAALKIGDYKPNQSYIRLTDAAKTAARLSAPAIAAQ